VADLTPWNHWRMPSIAENDSPQLEQGPVLVTVEYLIRPEHRKEFLKAIHQYARIRRRDGAYRWAVYSDTEIENRFVEIFLVNTWGEHLRQHERQTVADRELERALGSFVAGDPKVSHLISN
jgi:quinol monooxygenase YgiN